MGYRLCSLYKHTKRNAEANEEDNLELNYKALLAATVDAFVEEQRSQYGLKNHNMFILFGIFIPALFKSLLDACFDSEITYSSSTFKIFLSFIIH